LSWLTTNPFLSEFCRNLRTITSVPFLSPFCLYKDLGDTVVLSVFVDSVLGHLAFETDRCPFPHVKDFNYSLSHWTPVEVASFGTSCFPTPCFLRALAARRPISLSGPFSSPPPSLGFPGRCFADLGIAVVLCAGEDVGSLFPNRSQSLLAFRVLGSSRNPGSASHAAPVGNSQRLPIGSRGFCAFILPITLFARRLRDPIPCALVTKFVFECFLFRPLLHDSLPVCRLVVTFSLTQFPISRLRPLFATLGREGVEVHSCCLPCNPNPNEISPCRPFPFWLPLPLSPSS